MNGVYSEKTMTGKSGDSTTKQAFITKGKGQHKRWEEMLDESLQLLACYTAVEE